MNGVHDMGGMHGFGPVEREEHEPPFHAEWEAHVAAINRLVRPAYYNIDEFRFGIERMDPAHYLRSTYYERWLATIEHNLSARGVISPAELESRMELLQRDPDADIPRGAEVVPVPPAPQPAAGTEAAEPRFAIGDAVVTRNAHPTGHTRLPRYARGKHGVIHLVHGAQTFPDSNAHGKGQDPQVLYNVRFDARELWGDSAEPNQTLYLDIWEPYLAPVSAQA
ncbi:MAG TPA: nitrile hydratase subunit beta [Thermomicrobiales bacterium]|nr:nitrile hydratase subunit beta [Thermomicrobiales bacterium]